MRKILLSLDKGWNEIVQSRFPVSDADDAIKIEAHQLDGLSWPMTLVSLLKLTKMLNGKQINIVVMGGSAKAEERLFCCTNYFEELTNFYPNSTFKLYFAGPELSVERHNSEVVKNKSLSGYFFRGTTSEFLTNQFENLLTLKQALPVDTTLFVGFNPGFGSGYAQLLMSWALDLVFLLNLNYKIFFT